MAWTEMAPRNEQADNLIDLNQNSKEFVLNKDKIEGRMRTLKEKAVKQTKAKEKKNEIYSKYEKEIQKLKASVPAPVENEAKLKEIDNLDKILNDETKIKIMYYGSSPIIIAPAGSPYTQAQAKNIYNRYNQLTSEVDEGGRQLIKDRELVLQKIQPQIDALKRQRDQEMMAVRSDEMEVGNLPELKEMADNLFNDLNAVLRELNPKIKKAMKGDRLTKVEKDSFLRDKEEKIDAMFEEYMSAEAIANSAWDLKGEMGKLLVEIKRENRDFLKVANDYVNKSQYSDVNIKNLSSNEKNKVLADMRFVLGKLNRAGQTHLIIALNDKIERLGGI